MSYCAITYKGDTDDVGIYSGITLIATLSTVFARVLNDRLNVWAKRYHVYIEAQAGFRQHMGTVDTILYFMVL